MLQIDEKSVEACIGRQMNNLRVIHEPDAHGLELLVIHATLGDMKVPISREINDCISSALTVQSFPAALSRIKLFVKREAILSISSATSHDGERLTDLRQNGDYQRNKQCLETPRLPFPSTCRIREPLPKTTKPEVGPGSFCRSYLGHHH